MANSLVLDETIKKLRSNDQIAYEELVDAYGERLLRLAYMVVGDQQLAEDVVQESFLAVYTNVHNFRGDSSFDTWMTRIALNKAKNKIRPKMWQKIMYFWDVQAEDTGPLPQQDYEEKEQKRLVKDTMCALPLKYRDVLYLYYYEEMKVKEIAQVLDVGESGIKSRLQRGREKMKALLVTMGVGLDDEG